MDISFFRLTRRNFDSKKIIKLKTIFELKTISFQLMIITIIIIVMMMIKLIIIKLIIIKIIIIIIIIIINVVIIMDFTTIREQTNCN